MCLLLLSIFPLGTYPGVNNIFLFDHGGVIIHYKGPQTETIRGGVSVNLLSRSLACKEITDIDLEKEPLFVYINSKNLFGEKKKEVKTMCVCV